MTEDLESLIRDKTTYEQRIADIRNISFSEQTLQLNETSSINEYIKAYDEIAIATDLLKRYQGIEFKGGAREKIAHVRNLEQDYPGRLKARINSLQSEFKEKKQYFERLGCGDPAVVAARERLEGLLTDYNKLEEIGNKVSTPTENTRPIRKFIAYEKRLHTLSEEIRDIREAYLQADWERNTEVLRETFLKKICGSFFIMGLEDKCKELRFYEGLEGLNAIKEEISEMEALIRTKHALCKRKENLKTLMETPRDEDLDRYLALDLDHDDEGNDLRRYTRSFYLRDDIGRYFDAARNFQKALRERKRAFDERQAKIKELDTNIATMINEKIEKKIQEYEPKIKSGDTLSFSLEAFLDRLEAPTLHCYLLRNILQGMRGDNYENRLKRFAETLDKFTSEKAIVDNLYLLRVRSGLERALTSGLLRPQFAYGKITQETINKTFDAIDHSIKENSEVHANA